MIEKKEFVLGNVERLEFPGGESFTGRKNFFEENEIDGWAAIGGTLDEKGDNLNIAIILAMILRILQIKISWKCMCVITVWNYL